MVVKLAVFENILHQLGDKSTIACSTLAKQHKILFIIGLLAILKHPLNLTQKLEVIRIVILSAASLVEKTIQSKQLQHSTLLACYFLLLGFDNP
jgi:putative Ca2+/H+ antiporter (TMEM165/GDT1 family)